MVSSPGDIAVKGMRYRWLPGPLVSRAFWKSKLEKKIALIKVLE